MDFIERIVACGRCGYTGTTQPGRHSPEAPGLSCYVCRTGKMVEFVNPAIVQGAVEALREIRERMNAEPDDGMIVDRVLPPEGS